MSCAACGHDDHGTGPCAICTTNGSGSCWQNIHVTGGDGTSLATGQIQMATGVEVRPCMACRSFEAVETKRMVQHLMAQKLEVQPDGKFKTPIAKDIPGRVSLALDPRDYGFCKRDTTVVDLQATCENWRPTKLLVDLQNKLRRL